MAASHPEGRVLDFLLKALKGSRSVLDVGCGVGTYLHACGIERRIAIDAYAPYLEQVSADVKHHGTAEAILPMLDRDSVDAVMCLDVIEHLEAAEGAFILGHMVRVARKIVVVFTPLGFHPQDRDVWEMGGDHWQTHRSGWMPEHFPAIFETTVWDDFGHGKPDLPKGALWAVHYKEPRPPATVRGGVVL